MKHFASFLALALTLGTAASALADRPPRFGGEASPAPAAPAPSPSPAPSHSDSSSSSSSDSSSSRPEPYVPSAPSYGERQETERNRQAERDARDSSWEQERREQAERDRYESDRYREQEQRREEARRNNNRDYDRGYDHSYDNNNGWGYHDAPSYPTEPSYPHDPSEPVAPSPGQGGIYACPTPVGSACQVLSFGWTQPHQSISMDLSERVKRSQAKYLKLMSLYNQAAEGKTATMGITSLRIRTSTGDVMDILPLAKAQYPQRVLKGQIFLQGEGDILDIKLPKLPLFVKAVGIEVTADSWIDEDTPAYLQIWLDSEPE